MLCSVVSGAISHSKQDILKVFIKCFTSLAHCFTSQGHGWLTFDRHWPKHTAFWQQGKLCSPHCSKVEWRCAGWDRLGIGRRMVSDCFPALLRMGYFCKRTCAGCLVSAGVHKKVEALNEWNGLTTLSSVRWLLPAASPLGLAEPALPVPGLALHWYTSLM